MIAYSSAQNVEPIARVKTFGGFDLIVRGDSCLSSGIRQRNFLRLLAFFALNRGKVFNASVIVEKVWQDKEYRDVNSVVRTQVFRLKKQLAPVAADIGFRIEFMHGGYCMFLDESRVYVDADAFTRLYSKIIARSPAADGDVLVAKRAGGKGGAGAAAYAASPSAAPAARARSVFLAPAEYGAAIEPATATEHGGVRVAHAKADVMPKEHGAASVSQFGVAAKPDPADRHEEVDGKLIAMCLEAFGIYRDGFLKEQGLDSEWASVLRLGYRRMWFRLVETFAAACFRQKRYADIADYCQTALQFEASEEYVHGIYMEALIEMGCAGDAVSHYEGAASGARRGSGLANSARLKELHRKAVRAASHQQLVDRTDIERILAEISTMRGAHLCGRDEFLGHCRVVKEISERVSCGAYICIVETVGLESMGGAYRKLCDTDYLAKALALALRGGDSVCAWNDKQILILVSCGSQMDIGSFLRRALKELVVANADDPETAQALRGGVKRLPFSLRMLPFGYGIKQVSACCKEGAQ